MAVDEGKDLLQKGFEKLLKDAYPELAVLEESLLGKAMGPAAAFLKSTPLADWGASYESSVTKVQQQLERMRVDLADYQRNGYAVNIWADRDELQKQLDSMNSIAAGMIQEHGLGDNACYSVIDYENSALNASFALMFSKMPPRPQVGAR